MQLFEALEGSRIIFEGLTPLVQASAAPADAAYSGLLECPCTDRVVKQVRHVSQCRHVAQCRHVSQCRHVDRSRVTV